MLSTPLVLLLAQTIHTAAVPPVALWLSLYIMHTILTSF